ncbi:hypothetical protein N7454_009785 [Penicillium verhagenii]|nr:hypothetical protein N7454_009785 [Penicillium verhagenii]
MSSGSFNNFQTLLDQQVGSLQKTLQLVAAPASAAWVTAGGGMAATLAGVRRIFRNFRGLKYF